MLIFIKSKDLDSFIATNTEYSGGAFVYDDNGNFIGQYFYK